MRSVWFSLLLLASACAEHGELTWLGEPVRVRFPHADTNGHMVEEVTLEDQGVETETDTAAVTTDTDINGDVEVDTDAVITESGEIMANGYDEDGDGFDLCWSDLDSDGFGDPNNPRLFSMNYNPQVLSPEHPCQLMNINNGHWSYGSSVVDNADDPDDQNSHIPVND